MEAFAEFKIRIDGAETFIDHAVLIPEDQIGEIVLVTETTKSGKRAEFCRLFVKNTDRSYEIDYKHEQLIQILKEAGIYK